jgi:glycosyltransferase involved in cell wall biosynthesis
VKVAIIVAGGVDRSGTHRVIPCLLWTIERLVAAGDEVHVFTFLQEPRQDRWELLGASVHNAGRRLGGMPLLRAFLAEHRAGRFDVLHALWAVPAGLWASLLGRLLRIPVMLSLPGGDLAGIRSIDYGGQTSLKRRAAVRLAIAGADRICVASAPVVAQAARLGIDAARLPLGVALDRWPSRAPRRRSEVEARLLHVASLNRVKDQPTLLRAAALLADRSVAFRLDIVGEDTLGGEIQRLAVRLGLADLVHFHGFLPHATLRPWMDRADVLLVSSLHEGGPVVMLEAAIAGVPTVGTLVGHVAEWAPAAAVAVATGDWEALAEGVEGLLADEDRRLAIATAAQKRALAEDADLTARETRRVYAEIVGSGPT